MKSGGNSLNVSNLQEDIDITIPGSPAKTNFTEFFTQRKQGDMGIHYLTINSTGTSYDYDFGPAGDIVDTSRFQITVYIRYNARPTREKHDYKFVLPNYTTCSNMTKTAPAKNCLEDPYSLRLSSETLTKLGTYLMGVEVGLTEENFDTNRESDKQLRTRRDCLEDENGSKDHRSRRSCIKYKDPPPKPTEVPGSGAYITQAPVYNPATDFLYVMRSTASKCVFWNEASELWSSKGCKVYKLYIL